MDDLVKQVASLGISEDLARQAVTTVLNFLKQKLPAPIASQIDGVLEGGGLGNLGDVAKGLGGVFKRS
ncbi:MAG: hypothetical protein GX552_18095 [Chloroflexi bacterium]|jgi:hypothetical protein|nr:hypothetical protein [Chloroflexota bacterium]